MAKYLRVGLLTLSLLTGIIAAALLLTIWCLPLYLAVLYGGQLADRVALTNQEVLHDYWQMLTYLNFPWRHSLDFAYFPSSASARFHFYEVKRLFLMVYPSLVLGLGLTYVLTRKPLKAGSQYLLYRIFAYLRFLPLLALVGLVLNFNWVFLRFHELLFDNQAWLFDPSRDPIIEVLPESYFMLCFILFFILFQLGIQGVYHYLGKKLRTP
ncbi:MULTISPECIES: TIGR01906 family membrane protein [Aerococcus]|uniref:TIGR01906 family membrane protein n=1 Tax=Aerococcus sanguinicola TaxID=119206 RepID=A0A5N1GLL5_9LACT|nr:MULTISPECIES: TIGR01906 family membrane protein [Aerococcus]KAA9300941.1 TIGR01906 family membrane protein [Aerococcus sanguinicola]MDK6369174.1 TIGR01906 family membrane protein [Aerococcus sp. UMB9870]MDK6679766.1 TIGR01906 family membrane protein [Aerococcus sp. UMB8608]MDK6686667.1 TIGR01906 family membrane protein [Aerococcus sp. UMB8623]MDK6939688.1 TIGR01906 family membrane protein [Aerococcus sp. UMB8487]